MVNKYISKAVYIIMLACLLLCLSLICSPVVHAATISGSIYDLGLDRESDVIVEINTVPKQFMVSKDGDYSFNVNPGLYLIHAYTDTSESVERINVTDNGNYTIDLILDDSMVDPYDDEIFSGSDSEIDVNGDLPDLPKVDLSGTRKIDAWTIIIALIAVISAGALVTMYVVSRDKDSKASAPSGSKAGKHPASSMTSSELDTYEKKILSLIKKERRTTQKDIRKEIPLSESKISLVIADLESKGKIRKIKKGRGNILIFEKD